MKGEIIPGVVGWQYGLDSFDATKPFKIGTGANVNVLDRTFVAVSQEGSVVLNDAAVLTNATDGFIYVAGCAGTPVGTPTGVTGRVPVVVDTTNNIVYYYTNGAWRNAGSGGTALAGTGTAGKLPKWTSSTGIGDSPLTVSTVALILAAATTAEASLRIPAGTAPTSPVEGDVWNDSAQKCLVNRVGGLTEYAVRCIYSQPATVTVNNTASSTTLLTTPAFGTTVIPANYLTLGKRLRITAWGSLGITGTPTVTLQLKKGGSTIASCTFTTAAAVNWHAVIDVDCILAGSSGNVQVGMVFHGSDVNGGNAFLTSQNTSSVSTDTTAANTFDLAVQWGTAHASNIFNCHGVTIEVIG